LWKLQECSQSHRVGMLSRDGKVRFGPVLKIW
jgi:hypothetical protein